MQLLVYIIAYPLLRLISVLPNFLFYGFSNVVFFLLFYLIGYRRDVVQKNLELTLPHTSKEERRSIEKAFYRHLCDLFLEMLKTMNLTSDEVKKRYDIQNIEVLQAIEKKKSVLILCTHYANWEWNTSINNYLNAKGYAVYQKIGNVYFDKLIKRIRSKWNTTPIEQKHTVKTVI